jgi:hypothetical protein
MLLQAVNANRTAAAQANVSKNQTIQTPQQIAETRFSLKEANIS